MKNVRGN